MRTKLNRTVRRRINVRIVETGERLNDPHPNLHDLTAIQIAQAFQTINFRGNVGAFRNTKKIGVLVEALRAKCSTTTEFRELTQVHLTGFAGRRRIQQMSRTLRVLLEYPLLLTIEYEWTPGTIWDNIPLIELVCQENSQFWQMNELPDSL